ncbi:MAG: toll/interleukin-1 receptor domain-containing protein [Saprospiraceae bacterium]|nr:toll/interleukin-1 receptor domain-containing protein [Saprospiraceae bacterium]
MAYQKHLEILKSGVGKWNAWRQLNKEVKPDLPGADLTGANLSGANFRNANLQGAILNKADLSFSNFIDSDLLYAKLENAYLFGAFFSGARLSKATFLNAMLGSTNYHNSTMWYTDFSGANLLKADLSNSSLENANLTNTNLSNADLTSANLSNANLSNANLFRTNLFGTNLFGANLSGANFKWARLGQTVFGFTNLSTCKNLVSVAVHAPCSVDFQTLRESGSLDKEFTTKVGLPELLMEYLPDFFNPALLIYPAFLSHSWADKEFVRKLYEALTKKGVTIWLDEKKMKPGDNIHDSISEGIKYYDKLLLVCSENSLNSWWVEKELEKVYEKEREMQKDRGKKFRLVIPIRIDDNILKCRDGILATVKSSVIGDFTKWRNESEFDKALKELVDALNANRPDIQPPSLL